MKTIIKITISIIEPSSIMDLNGPNLSSIFRFGFFGFWGGLVELGVVGEVGIVCAIY